MALPTTGSLSIKGAAGTTRSIACEVDGNITGNKSLTTLSVSASKTAPHCMREFYGYVNDPNTYVGWSTISESCVNGVSCSCECLLPSKSMSSGDYFYPNYCWALTKELGSNFASAFVCIVCNGTCIYGCSIANRTFSVSGTWTTSARCVDSNDTIHAVVCVSNPDYLNFLTTSCVKVYSITNGVGAYCVCTIQDTANAVAGPAV